MESSFFVYLLKGSSGRHYIGATSNLEARIWQHRNGHTHTTKRLGYPLELLAFKPFPTKQEALRIEKMLKSWKNPAKALEYLR